MTLLKNVLVYNLIAALVAVILRHYIDYFSGIKIIDYISYIGFAFWVVGGMSWFGNSGSTYEDLKGRDFDQDDKNHSFNFGITMITAGIPALLVSFVMYQSGAW